LGGSIGRSGGDIGQRFDNLISAYDAVGLPQIPAQVNDIT